MLNSFQQKFSERPFAIGSAFAIRSWAFTPYSESTGEAGEGALIGHRGYRWSDGVNNAECDVVGDVFALIRARRAGKQAPPVCDLVDPLCTCGFYAYWNPCGDERLSSAYNDVIGVAEMFGKATIGELGIRSEKARIVGVTPGESGFAPVFSECWDANLAKQYPSVQVLGTLGSMLRTYPLSNPQEFAL
jgi:hypothetical protein